MSVLAVVLALLALQDAAPAPQEEETPVEPQPEQPVSQVPS